MLGRWDVGWRDLRALRNMYIDRSPCFLEFGGKWQNNISWSKGDTQLLKANLICNDSKKEEAIQRGSGIESYAWQSDQVVDMLYKLFQHAPPQKLNDPCTLTPCNVTFTQPQYSEYHYLPEPRPALEIPRASYNYSNFRKVTELHRLFIPRWSTVAIVWHKAAIATPKSLSSTLVYWMLVMIPSFSGLWSELKLGMFALTHQHYALRALV